MSSKLNGTVVRFNGLIGNIRVEGEPDKEPLFFHRNEVEGGQVQIGDKVSFSLSSNKTGPCARTISVTEQGSHDDDRFNRIEQPRTPKPWAPRDRGFGRRDPGPRDQGGYNRGDRQGFNRGDRQGYDRGDRQGARPIRPFHRPDERPRMDEDAPAERHTGTVKFYALRPGSADQWYGFLVPEGGGQDIYFDARGVGEEVVTDGDRVTFLLGNNRKGGNFAYDLKVLQGSVPVPATGQPRDDRLHSGNVRQNARNSTVRFPRPEQEIQDDTPTSDVDDRELEYPPLREALPAEPALQGPRLVLSILAVTDLPTAADFYSKAFGWTRLVDEETYVEFALPGGHRLGLYSREGFAVNTGRRPQRPIRGATTATELYFYVADLAGTIEHVISCGADLLAGAEPRAWGEEVAYLADPEGNVLALAKPKA